MDSEHDALSKIVLLRCYVGAINAGSESGGAVGGSFVYVTDGRVG